MFDNLITRDVLNKVTIRALDARPAIIKSLFIFLLLSVSVSVLGIKIVLKKMNPRNRFTDDTIGKTQIKKVSRFYLK